MFLIRGSRFSSIAKLFRPNIHHITYNKCIHISAVSCFKKYVHKELELTYKFVQNYSEFEINGESKQNQNEFKLENNYANKSKEELISAFEGLSYHCKLTESCLSNDAYNHLVLTLVNEISNFSDNELVKVLTTLQRFPETPNVNSNNFYQLWMRLDEECSKRINLWKVPFLLKLCNLWLRLNLLKVGNFSGRAIIKICRRVDRLPPKILVETMFYHTICRKKIPMIDIETRFLQVIDELNVNETGIMCLAFFKTEAKMKMPGLVDKIYDKTIENISKIEDITMVNLMKTLRYSSDPSHDIKMKLVSDAILPYINNYSVITCLHIALLGTNLQYCHQQLFEAIVVRINQDLKASRLKDIERITFAMGLFDFKTESGVEKELLQNIIKELKHRVDEIMLYPKCLGANAHYLSMLGVYDIDIIRSVLKEDFINFAYGNNKTKIGREILCLDSFTRINLKSTYEGPQLSDKMRALITKFQSNYVPYRGQTYKLTYSDQLLLNLKEFMEERHGYNTLTQVLPHYQRPDIVYCFNENGKSVTKEIMDCFPPLYQGDILTREYLLSKKKEFADNIEKYQMVAVVLGGWNFYLRGTRIPTGGLRMKVEQLKMIGYRPILIHWSDWNQMSIKEKKKLIDDEVERALSLA